MTPHYTALASCLLTALLVVSPVNAQPTAAPEASKPIPPVQPVPTTVPGRPDIPNAEVAKQLSNVAPLPFGAPADQLPTPQLKLPKGFNVEVYASGIANARSLRIGDKGTVFVSNRLLDKVYAVVDRNGKREVKVIASGMDRPNGLVFDRGTLYIAEGTRISKLENIEDDLDNIRQAWEHAVERQERERVSRAIGAVYLFADKRGRFREGADLLQKTRDRLAPTPADDGELWLRLTTRLSLLRSLFPAEQQVPVSEVEHCRVLAHQGGLAFEEALAYLAIGMYYTRTANDYEQALTRFKPSLQLLRALDDRYYLAEVLARYGICCGYTGDVSAFYQYCREGCEIARSDQNHLGLLTAQGNLIEALLHLGRYTEVVQYSERQMALGEQFGARSSVAHGLQFLALARFLEGNLAASRQAATQGYVLSAEIQSALAMGNSLSLQSLVASVSSDFSLGRRFAEEAQAQPLNLLGLVQAHLGDAIARRGLGTYTDARRSLAEALQFARRFATVVPTLWVLPVAALLLRNEGRYADATALLALAHTHELSPRGWFTSWRALSVLRASLEQALEPEAFTKAWGRGIQLGIPAAVALLDLHLADDRAAVLDEQSQLPMGSG